MNPVEEIKQFADNTFRQAFKLQRNLYPEIEFREIIRDESHIDFRT